MDSNTTARAPFADLSDDFVSDDNSERAGDDDFIGNFDLYRHF